jgi:hypothetical protein
MKTVNGKSGYTGRPVTETVIPVAEFLISATQPENVASPKPTTKTRAAIERRGNI